VHDELLARSQGPEDTWGIKRAHDDRARCHATQKTVDARRTRTGAAARHPREHHPVLDRCAKAVGKVIPELNKKLTAWPSRATSDVSVVDLTSNSRSREVRRDLRGDEGRVRRRDEGRARYTTEKVVATDSGESARRCSTPSRIALDDTFVKVVSWYDNEWGYSCKCWRWPVSRSEGVSMPRVIRIRISTSRQARPDREDLNVPVHNGVVRATRAFALAATIRPRTRPGARELIVAPRAAGGGVYDAEFSLLGGGRVSDCSASACGSSANGSMASRASRRDRAAENVRFNRRKEEQGRAAKQWRRCATST